MPVTDTWGLENANLWVVCREHGLKFLAFLTSCPACRYGEEFSPQRVSCAVDVEVVPA